MILFALAYVLGGALTGGIYWLAIKRLGHRANSDPAEPAELTALAFFVWPLAVLVLPFALRAWIKQQKAPKAIDRDRDRRLIGTTLYLHKDSAIWEAAARLDVPNRPDGSCSKK